MKKVPADGETVKGLDLYHGDVITDVNKVMATGVQFVFLKAWELAPDSKFSFRWKAMKADGLIRGPYDFFHPEKDPVEQAKHFLGLFADDYTDADLPCVLDWEADGNIPVGLDVSRAKAWLDYVESQTKKTPIIYGGAYFLDDLSLTTEFQRYPLWIANYGAQAPLIPGPWQKWTFWQGSETGNIPGIQRPCDTDLFNGTLDQLKSLCKGT